MVAIGRLHCLELVRTENLRRRVRREFDSGEAKLEYVNGFYEGGECRICALPIVGAYFEGKDYEVHASCCGFNLVLEDLDEN